MKSYSVFINGHLREQVWAFYARRRCRYLKRLEMAMGLSTILRWSNEHDTIHFGFFMKNIFLVASFLISFKAIPNTLDPYAGFLKEIGMVGEFPKTITYSVSNGSYEDIKVELRLHSPDKVAGGFVYGGVYLESPDVFGKIGYRDFRLTDRHSTRFYNNPKLLEKLCGKKNLSVGCGLGCLEVRELQKKGIDIVGIDIATLVPTEGISYRGSVTEMPFADNSFDNVASFASVFLYSYPEDPAVWDFSLRSFKEIERVLKKGGSFFSDFNQNWIEKFVEDFPNKKNNFKDIDGNAVYIKPR